MEHQVADVLIASRDCVDNLLICWRQY